MEFVCARCEESFKRKDYLIAHLKRKNECSATASNEARQSLIDKLTTKEYNEITYDCDYCNKKFNKSCNKYRHKKTCKKNPKNMQPPRTDGASTSRVVATEEDDDEDESDDGSSKIIMDKKDFELMKQELKDALKKEIMQELASTSRVTNNTTNTTNSNNTTNTTNNTINIINPFGNESTSHLTKEFLSYCILNPKKGMASLIESIHYNKSIPENHNLRCKSLKQNVFEKYTEDEWRACDASNTLDELIRKGYKILNSHYADNIITQPDYYDDEQKQRAYERFRFLSDVTSNDYFAVKRELRILVKDRTMYLLASPDGQETDDSIDNGVLMS